MCSVTKKVRYTRKTDNILSLNIPLKAAVNKGERERYFIQPSPSILFYFYHSPEQFLRPFSVYALVTGSRVLLSYDLATAS